MLFAILIGAVIALGYFLHTYKHSYWSRRGFKQLNPEFFYGDAKGLLKKTCSMGEFLADVYNKQKESGLVGIYMTYNPIMVVTDPKLVQDIMIRDFNSFHDRPLSVDEENDPLSGHLFSLEGQKWRDLRVKLSPTFTSGKLKGMFPVIRDCGKVLDEYLIRNVNNDVDTFEFRDLMARLNTNIISSVAFGIDNDCINDPDHIFRKMGEKIFESDWKRSILAFIAVMIPSLAKKLKLKMTVPEVEEFFFSIVKQTVAHREEKNISRNDFLQLLIQLKNQGYVSVDKGDKDAAPVKPTAETGNMKKLEMNSLVAQAFVFYIAGFETSSSTMSFALFEIARRVDIQRKIQEEIDKVFTSAGADSVTYEMMGELKYLEAVIDETLRKYPIVPLHFRKATRDYKVAGTDKVIPKDTAVFIPVLGFHRDPEIYENPMEFKPERFLHSSNGGGTSEGVFYMPFGEGPRNCIGMRMGKLTTKFGIAIMLSRFNMELADKELNDKEIVFDPSQFNLSPKKSFNIKVTRR